MRENEKMSKTDILIYDAERVQKAERKNKNVLFFAFS